MLARSRREGGTVSFGPRSRARRIALLAALSCLLPLVGGSFPAQGASEDDFHFQGEGLDLQRDIDLRIGSVAPTVRQRQLVSAMGARATWNRFGTPQSLAPVELSTAGVQALSVIRNSPIGPGRAITFQQVFGALPAGLDGRITLGVADGKVAYVSSSLAPHATISDRTSVSAQRAMQFAGSRAGRGFSAGAISAFDRQGRSTEMKIRGFTGPQTASLVAVPTPTQGVRAAWLTQLIDAGAPFAV